MSTPLFTEAELRDLVSRDEGQFLEFKSIWDRSGDIPKQVKRRAVRDAIAETVAAFANADGGGGGGGGGGGQGKFVLNVISGSLHSIMGRQLSLASLRGLGTGFCRHRGA